MFCNMIWSSQLSRRQFRWMKGLMGGLATMELVMLKHGRMLSHYGACEFRRAYMVFRCALNLLAERAIAMRLARYHMRPKVHQLGHLVYQFLPKNPRYFMNYSDEDFIARSKRVAEKTHPRHMSKLTLHRYVINTCLRFSGELVAWYDRLCMVVKKSAQIRPSCRVHFFETSFGNFQHCGQNLIYIYITVLFCNIIWLKYSDELLARFVCCMLTM